LTIFLFFVLCGALLAEIIISIDKNNGQSVKYFPCEKQAFSAGLDGISSCQIPKP